MTDPKQLLEKNREWASDIAASEPAYFSNLAQQQKPVYLWIGCADSRVPANQIVGLAPGEVFVHRNLANVVVHTDFNCLSVIQYSVEVLRVRHIIVCGHYGCGGVEAALGHTQHGLIDNWLRHIKDVYQANAAELDSFSDDGEKAARLSELNVAQQVENVCETTIVQNAWARRQDLAVHGWIYGLKDGRLKDLGLTVDSSAGVHTVFRMPATTHERI